MFMSRASYASRFAAVTAVLMAAAVADAGAEPRAVIELFTSQGCSLCPTADKLLGELTGDPSLVALSLPIDYWDYLGWKDTLADPRHTARQKAYSHMRGDRDVYTPQMVINGAAQALGSDKAAIEQAITQSHAAAKVLTVPLAVSIANGKLSVSAPNGKTEGLSGEIWLWGLAKSVAVAVGRGENNGRTLIYTNVVRRWVKLGTWGGASQNWTVPVGDIKTDGVDSVAVILQSGSADEPGPILGAALAALH